MTVLCGRRHETTTKTTTSGSVMRRQKTTVFVLIGFAFVCLLLDLNLFHSIQSIQCIQKFNQNLNNNVNINNHINNRSTLDTVATVKNSAVVAAAPSSVASSGAVQYVLVPPITAKSVMLDHVNSYVMSPLSHKLEEVFALTSRLPGLTANQISYFGVIVALIASKVVVSESLHVRRIAVLVFLLRQFVDDLDGLVARIRMGLDKRQELSITGTSGYVVDGVCDAIGFTVFVFAVFVQCVRHKRVTTKKSYEKCARSSSAGGGQALNNNNNSYKLLPNYCSDVESQHNDDDDNNVDDSPSKRSHRLLNGVTCLTAGSLTGQKSGHSDYEIVSKSVTGSGCVSTGQQYFCPSAADQQHSQHLHWLSASKSVLLRNHVLFGLQMLMACVLWNRYIEAFHTTLEVHPTLIKVQIFKSRLQWIIMWLWRCYGNAHQLMNFFLVSVWMNRTEYFVQKIHFFGFVALLSLSFLTEVHLNDIESYLKHI